MKISFFSDYYEYLEFPIKTSFTKLSGLKFGGPNGLYAHQNAVYFAIFIINSFLNDILLFVFLTVCDLLLLNKFKACLEAKRNFNKAHGSELNKPKLKDADNIQIKVTLTILFNSIIMLLFRTLEFGTSMYVLSERLNESSQCKYLNKICTNYAQLGNLFYLMSCSYTIVIYYYLNKTFRTILDSLLNLKRFSKIFQNQTK